jgi:general secretion pathway protein G
MVKHRHLPPCEIRDGPRFSSFGFTLIELLVVMTIVALLLTLALPRYFGSIDKSKEAVLKENLHQMREAISRYYADKGRYPESLETLTTDKYLRRVPVDPITESTTTWQVVTPQDPEKTGVYDIKSGAPGKSRDGSEYSQW